MSTSAYLCSVERLARLFLIKEIDRSRKYLVVFTILRHIEHIVDRPFSGYFDETEKDNIVGIAGWVGSYEGWNRLEDEWRKALPNEANGDFHYTDFWARSKDSYGQDWDNDKRLEHIKTLAGIAHKCTAFGIGYVFDKRAYHELIPSAHKELLKSPLHFCFASCLAMLVAAHHAKH